jgi:hypothetical protein
VAQLLLMVAMALLELAVAVAVVHKVQSLMAQSQL